MLRKVLGANRGEIDIQTSVRRTSSVSIRSRSTSRLSRPLHSRKADEAYEIGEPGYPGHVYLDGEVLVATTLWVGVVDAVYPGYGFLSESATFVRACADAGLVFVGPLYRRSSHSPGTSCASTGPQKKSAFWSCAHRRQF